MIYSQYRQELRCFKWEKYVDRIAIKALESEWAYIQNRYSNKKKKVEQMSQQITNQYILDILQLLKNLAFHQILMEKLREQLADNVHFDPFTSFKTIDQFKHNMIINVQLKSFLQLQGFQVTNLQAQQAIHSLNKAEDSLNYDRFIEMVMPYNLKKRNLSLSRYERLEVTIGTYDLINSIKHTSRQLIAKFFVKEVQFIRNFHNEKQYFCQKWGADIYTISQILFKKQNPNLNQTLKNPLFNYQSKNQSTLIQSFDNKEIGFDHFYDFSRKYQCYFNKTEFKGIWRRIKTVEETIILQAEEISLKQQDLVNFLLVKNFNTKMKYANEYSIPFKNLQTGPPSYKLPVQAGKIHNSYEYRQQQQRAYYDKKIYEVRRQIEDPLCHRLKYQYSYPEIQHNCVSIKLKQKQQEWKDIVKTMNPTMIDQRYQDIMKRDKGLMVRSRQ